MDLIISTTKHYVRGSLVGQERAIKYKRLMSRLFVTRLVLHLLLTRDVQRALCTKEEVSKRKLAPENLVVEEAHATG
jgi:hypothetical protein